MLWEVDKFETKAILSPNDEKCEKLFVRTTTVTPDGRVMVRLPFTIDPTSPDFLGDSYRIAFHRLQSIQSKLKTNDKLRKGYEEYFNGYIEAGHLRLVTVEEISDTQNCYFMPHHAVFKESSTSTKIRVVFDASCKTTNGFSLNDRLLTGPVLQSDLFTIILRWRKNYIAFAADISKMYLQFRVHPEDAKFQRVLWPINEEICQFISTTVTFGTGSAP